MSSAHTIGLQWDLGLGHTGLCVRDPGLLMASEPSSQTSGTRTPGLGLLRLLYYGPTQLPEEGWPGGRGSVALARTPP